MKKLITAIILLTLVSGLVGCEKSTSVKTVSLNSTNNESFSVLDKQEDKITLDLEGKVQNLKYPIYIEKNRYYIPVSEIINNSNGEIKINNNSSIDIKFNNENVIINLTENSWINGDKKGALKVSPIVKDNIVYISLVDIANIFDLKTRWYSDKKTIKLYKNRDMKDLKPYKGNGKEKGILRFEDVAIGGTGKQSDSEYLESIRTMGEYLGKRKIPYNIAWIPRYINPKENVDADPSKENKFSLAELIYTLDFVSFNNGKIGLHGYTHQRDNEESGIGNEFGPPYPRVEDAINRMDKALQIAKDMDIKIDFFEAPHYVITKEQNEALESKFKYIFNNYDFDKPLSSQEHPIKAPSGRDTYYIPTPLYYVEGGKANEMVNKILNMPSETFAGLFYHPFLEQALIDFKEGQDGYPETNYKEKSILQRIIEALEQRNINIIPIDSIQ
ncbi:DUF2334 domain-containing protein [Clostridium tarantellae]|uniref:DUF2334 domain-containing protein n=1 Tax=Clostridium tarantellae TaxID=39493 RepID=A0A6I1MN10_9CLOT|nr:DUF2334 domain-containing protein [Clostridium tarantellae]MPQ44350.1 DUF2334 domain-containing protein [Clostridium tarantellae]